MKAPLPDIGTVFYRQVMVEGPDRRVLRMVQRWLRHEVRAIVDDRIVWRRWSVKRRSWIYEVELAVLWRWSWRDNHSQHTRGVDS